MTDQDRPGDDAARPRGDGRPPREPREGGYQRREGGERPRGGAASSRDRAGRPRDDASRGRGEGGQGRRDGRPARDGDRTPYAGGDERRRPFGARDGERKPSAARDGWRRPYAARDGERKPYAGGRDGGRKPYAGRDGERKPYAGRDGERKPYAGRDGERKPYAGRDGERKPYAGGRDGARKPYGPRDGDARRSSRSPQDSDRRVGPRAPEIPEDVTPRDLAPTARNELKTLSKENAEQVARRLAMAARLIDDDPALAHEHALAASRRAGRIAVVRETVAITAYALGDFALALRELRTYRRLSGKDDQIALIVDSERGVGRPDRALEAGRAVDRAALPIESRVELAIAMSGARLDLGETERALLELDIPELDPDRAYAWSPALFAARAVVLEELGRDTEAREWRRRAEIAADALDAVDADRELIEIEEIEEAEDVVEIERGDTAAETELVDEPELAPEIADERPEDVVDAAGSAEERPDGVAEQTPDAAVEQTDEADAGAPALDDGEETAE